MRTTISDLIIAQFFFPPISSLCCMLQTNALGFFLHYNNVCFMNCIDGRHNTVRQALLSPAGCKISTVQKDNLIRCIKSLKALIQQSYLGIYIKKGIRHVAKDQVEVFKNIPQKTRLNKPSFSHRLKYCMVLLNQVFKNTQGFPGGSDGKESACNAGDPGSIPGLG